MKEKHELFFKSLGKTLREFRIEKGLSQQEVANRCDVDRAKISSIENGKEDFVLTTLVEITNALEIDLASFFKKTKK